MNAFIRWSAVLAVAAVAAVAGWVSYLHAWELVRTHGEAGMTGQLYPATIDGLVYVSSMVLLDSARRSMPAPVLARWLLAAGVAATLFANVTAGLSYGILGATVAAWPALALVGSYELLMAMIRGQAHEVPGNAEKPTETARHAKVAEVPADALDAAKVAYEASVRGGNALSARELDRRFGIGRYASEKLVKECQNAPQNGHKELEVLR